MQGVAAIARSFVIGRIERKCGIVSRERILGPAKPLQGYPFVVERLRVTFAVSRGQVIGGERFLETAELLQNIASIELRFRIGRTSAGGFFISGESIFVASEFLQDRALANSSYRRALSSRRRRSRRGLRQGARNRSSKATRFVNASQCAGLHCNAAS